MQVSIIIPAFNEATRLPTTFKNILIYHKTNPIFEIIIVDDGSRDATSQIAKSRSNDLPIKVISLPKNKGKGAATRAGVLMAKGDYILLYDADGATPIEEILKILPPLVSGNADIVIGSRVLGEDRGIDSMSLHRRLMGRVYRKLCQHLVPGLRDTACGFKLFRKEVAKHIFSLQQVNRYAFDVEILSIALQQGYRIQEIPVHWTAIPGSKVRIIRDTFQMTWSVFMLYMGSLSRKSVKIVAQSI